MQGGSDPASFSAEHSLWEEEADRESGARHRCAVRTVVSRTMSRRRWAGKRCSGPGGSAGAGFTCNRRFSHSQAGATTTGDSYPRALHAVLRSEHLEDDAVLIRALCLHAAAAEGAHGGDVAKCSGVEPAEPTMGTGAPLY